VYSYRNKKANQHYCALLEEELGLKISTIRPRACSYLSTCRHRISLDLLQL